MIFGIILYLLMILFVYESFKSKNIHDFLKKSSFKKIDIKKFIPNVAKYTAFLLMASIAVGLFFYGVGMEKDAKIVAETISKLPLIHILVTILMASFAEEVLFRGYLLKKTNIWMSSFIFAILHAGYGSITEIIGAFILGAILAKQFLETKNIWNVILTHLIYNLIVVMAIFGV